MDSRKSEPTEAESDNPTQFHYETKVLGDDIGSGANNDGDSKDLVKSVTVKRDPNIILNKNKNIEDIFKVSDKNGEDDKLQLIIIMLKF